MSSPVPRVDISSLSMDKDLGRGGQGRVVAVNGFMISGQWPAAAKIYAADHLSAVDSAVLEQMVGLPRQLTREDSAWLLENTAWPAVVAENDGAVCGFLMRTVPAEYYFDFLTRTLGSQRKLADVAFLLNPDSYVSSAGITATDRQRLLLLKSLAALLTRLHSIGVVVGDLSPKNLLFSLRPSPGCFLIDCDAAQLHGQTVLRQVETPDWEAPPGEARATTATDSYKFGLLAIRLFARDQSSHDPAVLTAISAELGRLAGLSQQADAQARPMPGTWTAALDAAAARAEASTPAQATVIAAAPVAPAAAAAPRPSAGKIAVPSPVLGPVAGPVPGPAAAPAIAVRTQTPRSRRAGRAILTAGGILLAVVIAIAGVLRFESHPPAGSGLSHDTAVNGPAPAASSAPASTGPAGPSPASTGPPSVVGVVNINGPAVDDPQAVAVARMFNTYFSGIDSHHYRKALSVFNPSGIINPDDPSSLSVFRSADRTSDDTQVVLTDLEPADGTQVTAAEVTFQSQQAAGYGPSDNPGQTCTQWDITYKLTLSPSGQYQIYSVTSDTHDGC